MVGHRMQGMEELMSLRCDGAGRCGVLVSTGMEQVHNGAGWQGRMAGSGQRGASPGSQHGYSWARRGGLAERDV